MFGESASSFIWASINSWFTPTSLFLLLNFMIATTAVISILTAEKQHQNQPRIARFPSLLHRLKSMNVHPQNPSDHQDSAAISNQETQPHYFFQEISQENLEISKAHYLFDEIPKRTETQTQFVFDQKDSILDDFQDALEEQFEENDLQTTDEVYRKLTGCHFSRTKSDTELPASFKSAFEEEEIVEARRPATVRERRSATAADGDEEVDAKADDFINKFKLQLKLQRMDSIGRHKNMKGRKSGGG